MFGWIQGCLIVSMTAIGVIWLQVHADDDTIEVPVDAVSATCAAVVEEVHAQAVELEIFELEVLRNAVVARMEATNLQLASVHDSELRTATLIALERMQDELDVTQARLVELGYQGWYKMRSAHVDY